MVRLNWLKDGRLIILCNRRILTVLILSCIFSSSSSVQALSWHSEFVVWNDKVYEIKEEVLKDGDIGQYIGKVDSEADDYTGDYDGDASNVYPIGTEYYEIKNLSSDQAIAVEIGNQQWKKAEYIYDTPFRLKDLIGRYLPYTLASALLIVILVFFIRRKKAYR